MPNFDHAVTLMCDLVERETKSAILVRVAGEQYWLPKSHVAPASPVQRFGDKGQLIVTMWIAREKGLL